MVALRLRDWQVSSPLRSTADLAVIRFFWKSWFVDGPVFHWCCTVIGKCVFIAMVSQPQ